MRDEYPYDHQPSVVGRGETRCDICQQVLEPDRESVEAFRGALCHSECVDDVIESNRWDDDGGNGRY